MATAADEVTIHATDAQPWRRQRWATILAGFALAYVVGIGCASLTKSFGDWNHGFAWERALMIRMHTPLPPIIDALMLVFPWFGTNISLIPAIALICWWLWRSRERHLAVRLGVVQLGSYLLNPSLKALFDRARPDLFERRGWYGWSSYPSGHAIASVSVLMTLAIILHRVKGWTWQFYAFIPIMIASLYSRVYLGVHWPTDVIAGVVVGLVWLLASMFAFRDGTPVTAQS
jgi:membrane-associated phospholipid phosphatase